MEPPSGAIAVKTFSKSRIVFDKELGSGTFGKVYRGSLSNLTYHFQKTIGHSLVSSQTLAFRTTGTVKDLKVIVAVKIFYQDFFGLLPNVDSKLRASALDELSKVAVLDHENIVRLLGMVDDSTNNYR
jgi:serine/threonine protein kinase